MTRRGGSSAVAEVAGRPGTTDERSDEVLADAVRAGDLEAYGVLWDRHETAVRSFAKSLRPVFDIDELVSESFLQTLLALLSGKGPRTSFVGYLLASVSRLHGNLCSRHYGRLRFVGNSFADAVVETAPPADELALEHVEQTAAWRAWESLGAADRELLWALLINGEPQAKVAASLGVTTPTVSARGRRASERLRQAFLAQHIRRAQTKDCAKVRAQLPRYERGALAANNIAKIQAHLGACEMCAQCAADVAGVNATMRAAIPLLPFLAGGTTSIWQGLHHQSGAARPVGGFRFAKFGWGLLGATAIAALVFGAVASGPTVSGNGSVGDEAVAVAPLTASPQPTTQAGGDSATAVEPDPRAAVPSVPVTDPAPKPSPSDIPQDNTPSDTPTPTANPTSTVAPATRAPTASPQEPMPPATTSKPAPVPTAAPSPTSRRTSTSAPVPAPRPTAGTADLYVDGPFAGWTARFTVPATWRIVSVTGPAGASCGTSGQSASCQLANGAETLTVNAVPVGTATPATVHVEVLFGATLEFVQDLPLTLS
ncbi:MAG: hypothetical protein FWD74_12050 [Actinomycetia bacterium]|nr:hypothetical protein [Actinomycetes bacterium]